MSDVPSAPDEVARLRAANARLRQVVEAKDTEIAVLRTSGAAGRAASASECIVRGGRGPAGTARPESAELLEAALERGAGQAAAEVAAQEVRAQAGTAEGPARGDAADDRSPDEAVTHEPGRCAGCGAGLLGAPVTGTGRRQVTDLPEVIRAVVTEHRIISRRCSCGTVTSGAAPEGVTAPVQYGPRLSAAAAYLWHGQFLSRGRTCEAIGELFGVPVSPAAVAGMVKRIAGKLGGTLEAIRAALAAAGVAHADETGFRVAGKLAWVHSASSGKYVLITVHPKRGRQAMDAAGVIPQFRGVLVHDAWAPYDTYGRPHARPVQRPRAAGTAGRHRRRPGRPVVLGRPGRRCTAGDEAPGRRLPRHRRHPGNADQEKLAEARHRYHSAVLIGKQAAARAGPLMRRHHALARRLLAREDDYLRFTTNSQVPFDNNAAEVRHEVAREEWAIRKEGRLMMAAG